MTKAIKIITLIVFIISCNAIVFNKFAFADDITTASILNNAVSDNEDDAASPVETKNEKQEVTEAQSQNINWWEDAGTGSWWKKDIWQQQDRGFLYYAPPKSTPKKKIERKPRRMISLKTPKEWGEELHARLNIAIASPTPENLKLYYVATQFIMQRIGEFSDNMQKLIWTDPDSSLKVPTAQFAEYAYTQYQDKRKQEFMQKVGKEYSLIFFVRSDCLYCHIQIPVMRMAQKAYNMDMMVVTVDGIIPKDMPEAKLDNGISQVATNGTGISVTPATFLFKHKTKESIAVGVGTMSMQELTDRINYLVEGGVQEPQTDWRHLEDSMKGFDDDKRS